MNAPVCVNGMRINFQALNEKNQHFDDVIALYRASFPQMQRLPAGVLRRKLRNGKPGFEVIYDDQEWVGFIYNTLDKDIVFMQLFAIADHHRSAGYGSKVIDVLKAQYKDRRILANIEVLDKQLNNYKQRVSRKAFYERNGFRETGLLVKEPGDLLEAMIYGGPIDKVEIEAIYRRLFGRFLGFFLRPKVMKKTADYE